MPVAAMFVAVVLTNFSRSITSVCLYVVTDCVSKEGKKILNRGQFLWRWTSFNHTVIVLGLLMCCISDAGGVGDC